jgi:hypothetical protein
MEKRQYYCPLFIQISSLLFIYIFNAKYIFRIWEKLSSLNLCSKSEMIFVHWNIRWCGDWIQPQFLLMLDYNISFTLEKHRKCYGFLELCCGTLIQRLHWGQKNSLLMRDSWALAWVSWFNLAKIKLCLVILRKTW